MSNCRTCTAPITRHSRSGLCHPCAQVDPEIKAKRIAALRHREATDMELLTRRRAHMAEFNLRPESRERVRAMMTDQSHLTAEARARGGKIKAARRLAHIPPAYRDLYRTLTRKGCSAAEAAEAVEQQFRADRRRG